MNVVITMAGVGSRFRNAGYMQPKYMIEVRGKTLFRWSMESLANFRKEQHIFLVRKDDGATTFIRKNCSDLGIERVIIIELERLTRGQAETAIMAASVWQEKEPLMVYNIDTYVEKDYLTAGNIKGDGCIPCFNAEGTHWSFVKLGDKGKAIEVREKKRISDNCSIGAYYFRSGKLYEKLYRKLYDEDGYMEKGERYIAPMYNLLIEQGGEVYIQDIPSDAVHVLGTPEEVMAFAKEGVPCISG